MTAPGDARAFGATPDGPARLFRIGATGGPAADLTDWGARLVGLWPWPVAGRAEAAGSGAGAPGEADNPGDIVLGFDRAEDYVARDPYFGATCGRMANRIGGACFELDGQTHAVTANEGRNCLHGGARGFDKRLWRATPSADAVVFERVSPHGEEGFPGNVRARVVYSVSTAGLQIEMSATSDAPTVVNLAHHSYFNLNGHGAGDVRAHVLRVHADAFTPTGPDLVPTGQIRGVDGGPLDFRVAAPIGPRLAALSDPGVGFDHNFAVAGPAGSIRPVADLSDGTGRVTLRVTSDQPGLQFYTGGHLPVGLAGKAGAVYGPFAGLCLETQLFPDAPNQPHFASARLEPGAVYRHRVAFTFTR